MSIVVARREFDVNRDAHPHVFLTDDAALFEIVDVRGFSKDPAHPPLPHAAARLVDCCTDLSDDPAEEIKRAAWVPLAEIRALHVVETEET